LNSLTVTAHVLLFTDVTGAVYITAHVLPLKLVTHVFAISLLESMLIPVPVVNASCLLPNAVAKFWLSVGCQIICANVTHPHTHELDCFIHLSQS
jgi:hypothetical protein